MDWNGLIEAKAAALHRILAALAALAGGLGGRAALQNPAPHAPAAEPPSPHDPAAEPEATDGTGGGAGGNDPAAGPTLPECPPLPRHLHRALLRLVRPAEAAARRLVIMAARDLVVALPPPRPRLNPLRPAILSRRPGACSGTGIVMPRGVRAPSAPASPAPARGPGKSLPLFDPLPRLRRRRAVFRGPGGSGLPRISVPGWTVPAPVAPWRPPAPGDPVDATRLRLRLAAVAAALADLPGQARRYARWRARRDRAIAAGRITRVSALRPGPAWGARRPQARRPEHEIDELVRDLHYFATIPPPPRRDSS